MNRKWRAPQEKTVGLIPRLTAAVSPQALVGVNRAHWGLEIMQRNHAKEQRRHPRQGRLTQPLRQRAPQYFLSHRIRSQNPAQNPDIGFTLADPSHRTLSRRQKPRCPSVLGFSLNHPVGSVSLTFFVERFTIFNTGAELFPWQFVIHQSRVGDFARAIFFADPAAYFPRYACGVRR
jgi:hypothetical protein